MDLMNAMNLPATSEPPRTRRSERVRQEEEPMVSFPTMLERSARPEKMDAPTRTDRVAERPGASNEPSASSQQGEMADPPSDQTVSSAAQGKSPVQGQETQQMAASTASGTGAQTGTSAPALDLDGEPASLEGPQDPAPENKVSAISGPRAALTSSQEETPTEGLIQASRTIAQSVPATEGAAATPAQTEGQMNTRQTGNPTPLEALPADEESMDEATEGILPEEGAAVNLDSSGSPDAPVQQTTTEGVEAAQDDLEIVELKTSPISATPAPATAAANPPQEAGTPTDQALALEEEADPMPAGVEETQQSLKIQHAKQKYEQPQVMAASEDNRITLADLDLDSGSMDSFLNKDNLATALKSAALKGHPLQQHIRAQVSQQVVEHLRSEMAGQKLTLRLNPEELGQVEINLLALDDKLTVSMSAENKQAEAALKEGTRELADSIGEKSSRFSMVEVRVETRGQQDQGKNEARQDDPRRERENEQNQSQNQDQSGRRQHPSAPHQTGASEWAAFHLGGQ